MPPGRDVLSAALDAGLAVPYSCRAGRCASCKSRLLVGEIHYPNGQPPGITPTEVARGEVLLCQARPLSDLTVEVRRAPVRGAPAAIAELLELQPLPLGSLRLSLRFVEGALAARPGQFVELRNHAGDAARLPVVGATPELLHVESAEDGGELHRWLSGSASVGAPLRVSGPYDTPR